MVNESEVYVKYIPKKYGKKSTVAQVRILFAKSVFSLHVVRCIFL